MQPHKPLLNIENLSVTYHAGNKEVYAVQNASLTLDKGESMGIVGESGSGKSTLCLAFMRLLDESYTDITGSAVFNGEDLVQMDAKRLNEVRWQQLSVVFQKSLNALSPVHKIGNQFFEIYRVHEPKASKEDCRKRAAALFSLVDLSPRVYDLYPHELSGGMMQRVAIALSLLHDPDLVVFDEATTALDVVTQTQILEEVKKLQRDMNMAHIIITHDVSVVATSCKKVAVLYAGQLVELGDTGTVFKQPAHPYTQGLLKSFPDLNDEDAELYGIPGSLPDLSVPFTGCNFASRCPRVQDQCQAAPPPEVDMGGGHMAKCHRLGGDAHE